MASSEVTKAVAEFVVGPIDAPADLRELAVRSLVDTVGVLIAAREEEAVRIQRSATRTEVVGGSATVLYDGSTTDAETAALLNGTAAHALDFDLSGLMRGHPGAIVWPAALAVAEELGASGSDLVDAVLVAYEVCGAIADGMDILEHHSHWHSTATVGLFGAVAAASRLFGLDVDQTRFAFGIAGSMASGSRQNFGTMTKPLHAGLAARDGIYAARLAAAGFTGSSNQLEGKLGFYWSYSNQAQPERVLEALAKGWTLRERGLRMKMFPCCYSSHRAITAAMRIHEAGIDPDAITRIDLTLEPNGLESIIHHRPTTGDEAKFSGEYVVAAALVDGQVRLESFHEEEVHRADLRRLIECTTITESAVPPIGPSTFTGKFYATLAVETRDGARFEERVDVLEGEDMLSTTREAIEAKFRDCLDFAHSGWDASALLAELWAIDGSAAFRGFSTVTSADAA